jgi:DNA-binding LacI/PurR family transcriptional regulator
VKQRVLAAARKLDYTAHRSARRTHVTILVEGFSGLAHSHYVTATLSALVVTLENAGYRPDIVPVQSETAIEIAAGHYAVAILALVWSPPLRRQIRAMQNVPVVLINDDEPGWHSVRSDNRQGMKLAVDHLVDRGHRRIGLLRYYAGAWADRERLAGYREALAAHGIPADPDLLVEHNVTPSHETEGQMLQIMAELMRHAPTALIVGSEDLALPALHALHSLNVALPADLSVVSYECDGLSAYLQPPLTSIDQNPVRIAEHVVDLIAQLDAGGQTRTVVLPNDLIERFSVRRLTS